MGSILYQILNKPSKSLQKYIGKIPKVVKFLKIWSHWILPSIRLCFASSPSCVLVCHSLSFFRLYLSFLFLYVAATSFFQSFFSSSVVVLIFISKSRLSSISKGDLSISLNFRNYNLTDGDGMFYKPDYNRTRKTRFYKSPLCRFVLKRVSTTNVNATVIHKASTFAHLKIFSKYKIGQIFVCLSLKSYRAIVNIYLLMKSLRYFWPKWFSAWCWYVDLESTMSKFRWVTSN